MTFVTEHPGSGRQCRAASTARPLTLFPRVLKDQMGEGRGRGAQRRHRGEGSNSESFHSNNRMRSDGQRHATPPPPSLQGLFNGKPGDLIEINRGPYNQWAVYIGENEVVYFTTEGVQSSGSSASLSSSPGKVKRETFKNVVGNDRYQVNNLLDKTFKARDPSVIEKEACAMVGRELEYDNKTYNCEHFAIEMRYGKAESRQVCI
ncbi:phospholipase A and acyltransferase 4-like [Limanda limanda]|uniref:phospholipase A and acyltransferase 4-like n=1 Tax=Limanda limanda TaxID=27771 RepID=UPI0029C74E55|nr:phospholipase A and acyltransferase 4-like [Limanda limanda]